MYLMNQIYQAMYLILTSRQQLRCRSSSFSLTAKNQTNKTLISPLRHLKDFSSGIVGIGVRCDTTVPGTWCNCKESLFCFVICCQLTDFRSLASICYAPLYHWPAKILASNCFYPLPPLFTSHVASLCSIS